MKSKDHKLNSVPYKINLKIFYNDTIIFSKN